MSTIPKHETNKRPRKGKKPQQGTMPTPPMQHDINYVAGLGDVEASLDWIAKGIARLTSEDHSVGLTIDQGAHGMPVQLTLAGNDYDDTMDRLVTAMERIADSVAKLAGLTRPRLESWHEQDEYEPRYKDIAVDGGASGPKAQAGKAQEGSMKTQP